jgi:NADPH2:quinone reductase
MRAAVYAGVGGIEVIQFREVSLPEPGAGQVRVRVRAAGLNRADILQRKGNYPAPPGWPSDIPGMEYAGEVESTSGDVTRWEPGDRVMGLVGGGAHAEFVVVHESEVLAIPPNLSFSDAAAIPEAFLTAYDALAVRARTSIGDRVLIHAVGSGVGTAATQVARVLGAATVLGTSRTATKLDRAKGYGMDVGLNTRSQRFRDQIDEPVNVILDLLGGPMFEDNLAVLATRGRMVLLGFLAGPLVTADLSPILRKRLEIIGTVMRTRTLSERAELIAAFAEDMLPQLTRGILRPVVGANFPMLELARAHQLMERDESFGKIVLTWE